MAESRPWVPKLELPKGGGAVAGVGEAFEANAFTGAGSMSVPVVSSPGRGAPSLSLGYASGGGNGPFGVGWSLGTASIARKTSQQLPRYVDAVESDTFVLLGAEDLVPLRDAAGERVIHERGDTTVFAYRPRVEGGFARIERHVDSTTGDTRWRVLTKDNQTLWFGVDASARISDPEDPRRVFQWLLQEQRDDRGTITQYVFKAEDAVAVGSDAVAEINRAPVANTYLKRIRYGNATPDVAADFHFEIVLDYGEHGDGDPAVEPITATPDEDRAWDERADAFSSFRAGFDVRTRRLCRRVLMFHRFEALGPEPTLVASTDLTYDHAEHMAKLATVVQRAYVGAASGVGYTAADVPALSLQYSPATIQPVLGAVDGTSMANLPTGIGGEFRLADLDGEGLPGIVTQQGDALHYQRPYGGGRFGPPVPLPVAPVPARLGAGAQLTDIDGDGRLEVVVRDGGAAGFFARRDPDAWDGLQSFAQSPAIDWDDPQLQQLDLNADGLADVLIAKDDHFVWYPSRGRGGFEGPHFIPKPTDERDGPALVFADGSGAIFIADMTGDGLGDIVRVEHGAVVYWPNLGHGRFGRRVTMDRPPSLASADAFSAAQVRLADIDGSGTTDLVYLDAHGARVWFNHSGNGFSEATAVRLFPGLTDATAVEVTDLLGKGTACLVWSTEGVGGDTAAVHYVDLLAEKPHLLRAVDNNMGLQTRLSYEPSTVQSLRDRDAGRPWVMRLPFPAYVVTRVEHYDAVARRRAVQRYAYHHGYYDGVEREFRGFAMVERWDTEGYEDFNHDGLFALSLFDTVEENLHQPPVHTRTWFHTGAFMGLQRISAQLADEYWDGDPEAEAWRLPDTVLPPGLSGAEAMEAARALRGSTLRTEVYALDGTAEASVPYSAAEQNFSVVRLQAKGDQRHASFLVHERETLTLDYERDPNNPRASHAAVLEVDAYGDVLAAATVAYPARAPEFPEQSEGAVLVSTTEYCGVDDVVGDPDRYRAGVPFSQRGYELHGLAVTADAPVSWDGLRTAVADAPRVAHDAVAPAVRLRLLSASRSRFYADDLSGPLALGECGTRALPFVTEAAAMTAAMVTDVFTGTEVDAALLSGEGGYVADEGLWWVPSGRQVLDPARFFVPTVGLDPFDNPTTIEYDASTHFVTRLEDPLGNAVVAEHDFRVLAPFRITDPNGHQSQVGFDTRGMVVWTAVIGRDGEGDTPDDPTSVLQYDVFAWRDSGAPNWSRTRTRETHADPATRWLEAVAYTDGAGNVMLSKATAEPGLAPQRDDDGQLLLAGGVPVLVEAAQRWVGSGRTVFDNKGNALKQYEPYFSSTDAYEDETELREQGVTPLLHYDPLGRLIRTELPDGTSSAVVFSPWRVTTSDANDRVVGSAWEAERVGLPASDPQAHALAVTLAHGETPTVAHLDAQGRTVRSVAHDVIEGVDTFYETRTVLDVQGRVLQVLDARGNEAEARVYDLAGGSLRVSSVDAGTVRSMATVVGVPLRSISARGFVGRAHYDRLWRRTHAFVRPPAAAEILAARTVYGESLADPVVANHRGQVYASYDGAGVVTSLGFDFKGNGLGQTRRFALEYQSALDWSVLAGLDAVPAIEAAAEPLLNIEAFPVVTAYDGLSRPTTQTTADGSVTQLAYNDAGMLQRVDVAVRGAAVAEACVSNIDYDVQGRRALIVYGNGTQTDYSYDARTFRLSRLRTVREGDPAALQDLRYSYDPVGNVTEIADGAQSEIFFSNTVVTATQRFAYDAVYRLGEASGREHVSQGQPTASEMTPGPHPDPSDPAAMRAYVQRYVFDAVGNLERVQHDAVGGSWTREYTYAGDGNRLLSTQAPGDPAGVPLTYDVAGNMTSMPHLTAMVWDHGERLREVDLGGGGTAYYVYDGGGQRVRKVVENLAGTLARERLYIGSLEVYRERVGETVRLERQTLHVADDTGRIAMVETQTVRGGAPISEPANIWRYQYSNHLGATSLELDADAQVISYEEYHPYGTSSYRAVEAGIAASAKRYRYTGKERDEETGLDLMGARYYACWLGRWTASDPIGLGDGVNRFAYVSGNPISLSDPSGRAGEIACGTNPDGTSIMCAAPDTQAEAAQLQAAQAGDSLTPFRPGSKPEANAETRARAAEASRYLQRQAAEIHFQEKLDSGDPLFPATGNGQGPNNVANSDAAGNYSPYLQAINEHDALYGPGTGQVTVGEGMGPVLDHAVRNVPEAGDKAFAAFSGAGLAKGGFLRAPIKVTPAVKLHSSGTPTASAASVADDVAPVAPGKQGLGPSDYINRYGDFGEGLEASIEGGMLEMLVKIGPGTPSGGAMFREAVASFGAHVKGIRGSWMNVTGLSDNFVAFKENLASLTRARKLGLGPKGNLEEIAARRTFTGEMSKRLGFTEVNVVTNNADEVVVEFTKPLLKP